MTASGGPQTGTEREARVDRPVVIAKPQLS
jgi:hypothetical protein